MHKILIAGFQNANIMDEVASSDKNIQVIFSDSIGHTIDVLSHDPNTLLIHDSYYKSHKNEINRKLNENVHTKMFMFSENLGDRHLNRLHDVNYTAYTMKTHIITKEFLENLASFSKDLDGSYRFKELTIDYRKNHVRIGTEILILTPMEYDLLVYLKLHSCMTLSRDELIRAVWGYSFLGDSRTIDTHIKSLRRKLGPYRCLVKTVWGKGYKFQEC